MKTADESEGGGEPKKKVSKKTSQKPDPVPDSVENQQRRSTSKTKREKNIQNNPLTT